MTFSKIFKKIHRAFDWCGRDDEKSFRVTCFEHVEEIPSEFSEMLSKQKNVFLQPAYLVSLELSKPLDMHFAYACVEADSKPVAFLYFQLIKLSLADTGSFLNAKYFSDEVNELIKAGSNIFFKKLIYTPVYLMICGNVFVSGEHGMYMDPKRKTQDLLADLPLLMKEIIERAGETVKISGVVIKDFYDDKTSRIPLLEKEGYRKFIFEPNMILQIRESWKSFDDYLSDLSSKYRVRARNVFKRAAEIMVKEFTEGDIQSHQKQIDSLYTQVHKKAAVHFSAVDARYFQLLKVNLKDKFSFRGYFLDGDMVAFTTFIHNHHSGEAHLVGLDYALNKSHAIYPFLLYQYIEEAIQKGSKELSLGRTALEIKSTVGAKAIPLYCYVELNSPLSFKLIEPFLNSKPEIEKIIRDPFKEASEILAGN